MYILVFNFLSLNNPPYCKKWKFESLYICLEDTIEDRKLYEKKGIDVDFRDKPTPGERLEIEELNENLEGARWKIIRFIEQECDRSHRTLFGSKDSAPPAPAELAGGSCDHTKWCEDGFVLTVECLLF